MLLSEYLESHTQTEVADKTGLSPSAICRARHRNVHVIHNGKTLALYEVKRIDMNDVECNTVCLIKRARP